MIGSGGRASGNVRNAGIPVKTASENIPIPHYHAKRRSRVRGWQIHRPIGTFKGTCKGSNGKVTPKPVTMRTLPHLLALGVMLCAAPAFASFDHLPADPESIGMGGAVTAIDGDAFGIYHNPASPASAPGSSAGAALAIPYGEEELRTLSTGVNWRHPRLGDGGTISAGFKRYGSDRWHEETLSAGYARRITGTLHAGMSISRLSQGGSGLDSESATGLNAGLQAGLGKGVRFGAAIYNLNSPTIGSTDSPLPKPVLAGFAFRLKNGNLLTADVLAETSRPARLLAGGKFQVTNQLNLLAGLGTNPSIVSAGASLKITGFRLAGALSRHIDLGTTASIGLQAEW